MVKKISDLIASKLTNFEKLTTLRDRVIPDDSYRASYLLWNTPLITYFWSGETEQVDLNLHNYLTRTTISRVSEILNILSGGKYTVRIIKGIPYLIENDDRTTKVELPTDDKYNILL
jgi:hypothetical protein